MFENLVVTHINYIEGPNIILLVQQRTDLNGLLLSLL